MKVSPRRAKSALSIMVTVKREKEEGSSDTSRAAFFFLRQGLGGKGAESSAQSPDGPLAQLQDRLKSALRLNIYTTLYIS